MTILVISIFQASQYCMYLYYQRIRFSKKLLAAILYGVILYQPLISSASERPSCQTASPIIFGILPFVSAEQLVIRFSPLANYLSKQLHSTVRIETAPDFLEFSRRTNKDKRYDILFTAPHFYPRAHSMAGYNLVAGIDSPGMWAVIVVPRKSHIYKLNDLRGKQLATIHPAGLATLLIRKHLSDAGINPDIDITLVSTPSNDASLLSSYHGITDASSLMQPPFESAAPIIKNNMRIIAKTESTPHIPISVSSRISKDCADEIADILLKMNTTAEGKKALLHNNFSGFKKTNNKDYEKMKELLPQ